MTLAWTDAPGPVGDNTNAYVNNLDLVVEAGGKTYKGNVFGNGTSVAGGTADAKNNVESVLLPGTTSGRFRVKVVGTNIAADGVPDNGDTRDQDFALVVSNAAEADPPDVPVLVHERSAVNDPRPGGDGDRALEPGERFTLDETVRNAGGGPAAGPVAGVLSAGSGLTVLAQEAAAAWPTIPDGAARASSGDPIARVTAGHPCGKDVTGTLALTTEGETQNIPLALSTGAAQPATANSITHSPALRLPDNSATGVTSTINVSRPGHIKDLDVRIGAILHPWIGDLRIDIVGPDGTTVTLADHPGGPDNQGENMVGTVFDDEAPTNIASGRAPYSGRFKPQRDQLSRFDGKLRQGKWKLRVRDLVDDEIGSLVSWSTEMSRPACSFGSVPGPQTSIQSGPASPTTQTTARFGFTGSPAGGSYECRLDGSLYSDCASGRSYSGLRPGTHTFAVRAVDSTGNVDASPATRTWTVQAPPTPPPSNPGPAPGGPATPADTTAPNFALVPTAHSWTDARAGRLRVLAGCASACRVSAKLTSVARGGSSPGDEAHAGQRERATDPCRGPLGARPDVGPGSQGGPPGSGPEGPPGHQRAGGVIPGGAETDHRPALGRRPAKPEPPRPSPGRRLLGTMLDHQPDLDQRTRTPPLGPRDAWRTRDGGGRRPRRGVGRTLHADAERPAAVPPRPGRLRPPEREPRCGRPRGNRPHHPGHDRPEATPLSAAGHRPNHC